MGFRGTRLETGKPLEGCENNPGRRIWGLNLGNGTGEEGGGQLKRHCHSNFYLCISLCVLWINQRFCLYQYSDKIPRLLDAVEFLILANDTFLEIIWPIVETTARREQTGDLFVDMNGVISVLPQNVALRKS